MSKNFRVYKSSAGSGKTFHLVQEYLLLVFGGNTPKYFKSILAITFTVKAANEMKDRILSALLFLSTNTPKKAANLALKKNLLELTGLSEEALSAQATEVHKAILHGYSDFPVMTIDKFMHRVVRTFATDLGLTPDFGLEINQELINQEVIQRLFDQLVHHPLIAQTLNRYVREQAALDKSTGIDSILSNAASTSQNEETFNIRSFLESLDPTDLREIEIKLRTDNEAFLNQVATQAGEILATLKSKGITDDDVKGKSRNGVLNYLKKAASNPTIALSPSKSAIAAFEDANWHAKNARPEAIEATSQVQATAAEFYRFLTTGSPQYNLNQAIISSLYTLVLFKEINRLFQEVKSESNTETLSGFQQKIGALIQSENALFFYERFGEKFNHILIDEFQDTSKLQWQNLYPLVENSLAEGYRSIIVGDIKQSIYRWRNGDPDQFARLPDVVTPSEKTVSLKGHYNEQRLVNNYRSKKGIVAFNNLLFEKLGHVKLNALDQNPYNHVRQTPLSEDGGHVEFSVFDSGDKQEAEDAYIIQKLRECKANGRQWKDIAVLVRSNDRGSRLASRCIHSGIPVVSEESLLLQNNASIKLLIGVLKIQLDGMNLFNGGKLLAELSRSEKLTLDLHESLLLLRQGKMPPPLEILLKETTGIQLNNTSLSGSLSVRVISLIQDFELSVQNPFLMRFLDFLMEFELRKQHFQSGFFDYWEQKKGSLSLAKNEGTDAVQIMTVHKSKGLEFPIVIYANSRWFKSKITQSYKWISLEGRQPAFANINLNSLSKTPLEKILEAEKLSSRLDDMNVNYVALTRAQEELYVVLAKDSCNQEVLGALDEMKDTLDFDLRVLSLK